MTETEGSITMSEDYRNDLINNKLSSILMQAVAEPVIRDGEIVGFMLDELDKDSIYQKAGIRNEDVITEINGSALNDVTSTIKQLHKLKGATEINFTIMRNGSLIPMNINVQ